jgi:DNA-binding SARP family transcriptional activator
MSHLRFSLFGSVRVTREDRFEEQIRIRPTAMTLLAYLLLYRNRSHRREVLAGLFWGGMDDGRAKRCLNTTLWRLRSTLDTRDHTDCSVLDTVTPGEIKFNRSCDIWLDVAEFEHKIMNWLGQRNSDLIAQDLEEAHQLYVGDLMEGYYEDWVLRERERLRDLYLKSLASLMEFHHLDGNLEKSLLCGQRILDMDPLREDVYRAMMRMYVKNGQRNLAIQHYKNCCEILGAELEIPPMLETQALYHELLITAPANSKELKKVSDADIVNYNEALEELKMAIRKLEMAQQDVNHVVKILTVLKSKMPSVGNPPQSAH